VFVSAPTVTFVPLDLARAEAAFSAARITGSTRAARVLGGAGTRAWARPAGAEAAAAAVALPAISGPAPKATTAATASSRVRAQARLEARDICMAGSGPFPVREISFPM
jgi:hypothetical protein